MGESRKKGGTKAAYLQVLGHITGHLKLQYL